jgi:hypothetical protein
MLWGLWHHFAVCVSICVYQSVYLPNLWIFEAYDITLLSVYPSVSISLRIPLIYEAWGLWHHFAVCVFPLFKSFWGLWQNIVVCLSVSINLSVYPLNIWDFEAYNIILLFQSVSVSFSVHHLILRGFEAYELTLLSLLCVSPLICIRSLMRSLRVVRGDKKGTQSQMRRSSVSG